MCDDSPCDFTKPMPVSSTAPYRSPLGEMWDASTRYFIYLTAEGDFNEHTTVARWLPLEEARAWWAHLERALDSKRGRPRLWGDPMYGVQLHTPTFRCSDRAQVGDLLFHWVVEAPRPTLTGAMVGRNYYLAGKALSVDRKGRIASYFDRDGIHHGTPRRCWVCSAEELEVEAVLELIARNPNGLLYWKGEFRSPDQASNYTVPNLRPGTAQYPDMGTSSVVPAPTGTDHAN